MSGNEKCRMYKETQSSIRKQLERGVELDKNICLNQIVLIKKDVTSNDENVRKTALEMLNFLINLNREDIEVELIKMLHDHGINKSIKIAVLKSVKQKVVDTISLNMFNFANVLAPWKNQNINQLTNIIEDVCVNDLPKDTCKHFFILVIIPTMMATNTNNQIRDALIDIAFMMSTILPISDLSSDELQSFLKDDTTKYIINIGDLRDKDYPNWHNLWIFLVRFCDKHIHYSMDLTNRLLRVVEFAFRNSSIQQRLKGYDCWKELIDNASLDMNHMCSPKQIKLLITPLKAKFSKQEVVICKRFDVFTYLLEKLQHKAVLCLTEFLEFCFGPVGDNKDITKTGQGKSVPQIWTKSTKVLIEIIGHSHGKTVSCLATEDVIKLEKPVINYVNILNYYKIIINSVGECCILLKEVDIDSKRETVVKCMWKSVFNIIIPTSDSNRNKYFTLVSNIMDNYIVQSRENPYFEYLLTTIFCVLMSYDEEFIYEIIKYILKQLLTILFTIDDLSLSVADKFKSVLTHWFSKIFLVDIKLKVMNEILTMLARLKPLEENIAYVGKIWLCLANELVTDLTSAQLEKFDGFSDFFIWPAYHLHHLDEVMKKQTVLHWMKLYRKITSDMESKKLSVMKDLQKVFKTNPLLNPNVVSLLNVMSQFETRFMKEFVNKIMTASSEILQLPNLKSEEEQKITALVMQYFEPSLECFKGACDDVVTNICNCIEYILCIHKGYKLLDTLVIFMKNSPSDLRLKFSKHLSVLLLDLFNKENDANSFNARELQKAIHVLNVENVKKDDSAASFNPPVGRSARIANMAKNSPRSPKRKGKNVESSPTALRLFGKDLDTLSPLQVKGSQLNNTTPKSKKSTNTFKAASRKISSINDEKSSDFVPINTEVKLQPDKLNKHQKEVLRKRREDIPALYQDLSQSLSQDIFSSSSSSKGFEKTDNDNADNKKVIVEVIGEQFETDIPKKEEAEIVFHTSPKALPEVPLQCVSDVNVPNLFPDAALSSEIIPEAPLQNIGDLNIPNTDFNFEANLFPEAMLPSEIIPEEVIQAIKEVTVSSKEINSEGSLFPQTMGCHKVLDPEETIMEEEKQTISESTEGVSKSKDTPVNPDAKQGLVSRLFISSGKKEPRQVEVMVEDREVFKSRAEEKERRRKQKIESELQKLRMDIVGAEEFIAASRRTRTREKPKKLDDDTSSKKARTDSTDSSDSKESTIERNRRKTIGVIQEITSDIGNTSKIEDKFNKPKDSETPKTRRGRRPSKSKLEDKGNSSVVNAEQAGKVDTTPKNIVQGEKRKHSNGDEESEDIIESSQQFHAELTPVFNSSKRKSLIDISCAEQMDKSDEKTLVQQKTVTEEDFVSEELHEDKVVDKDDVVSSEAENIPVGGTDLESAQKTVETTNNVNSNQTENKMDGIEEVQVDTNTSQDTTVTQESTQDDMTGIEDQIEEAEAPTELHLGTQDTQTQNTATQDTLTQSEFCVDSEDICPPVLYFDLPKKPELTESERMMCRVDTMSIGNLPSTIPSGNQFDDEPDIGPKSSGGLTGDQDISLEMKDVLDTPKPNAIGSQIPSSPITVETPNRTSELLNNTLDISPINSKSSSDDGESEDNGVPISINFKAEMEELDKMEKEKILELILEKKSEEQDGQQYDSHQDTGLDENTEMPVLYGDILTQIEDIPQQSDELPPQKEEIAVDMGEISYQTDENLDYAEVTSSSDHQCQAEELIPNEIEETPLHTVEILNEQDVTCQDDELSPKKPDMPDLGTTKPPRDCGIQERASRLLNMVNVSSTMTHKIYVKKRGITMSPSTARIKRLMSNFSQKSNSNEAVVDVREEDLLTFCRDIPSPLAVPRSSILKRKVPDTSDSDGISPCAKRKRVNFSDPCLTSKKLFLKDDYNRETDTVALFDDLSESKSEEDSSPKSSSDESPSSERLTETENVETEPSLEIVNALMLKKDKPIYPKLVDCKEDIILILKRVTSPMFITTLVNKLKNKEIKTIGDLAKQSEAEVNRFPFKVPVVPNVYKALDNYYKKNVEKLAKDGPDGGEGPKVNGTEESKRQGVIRKTSPKKVDYKVEFRQMIEKSKSKGTITELLKIIVTSVEKEQFLPLAKTHYNLEIDDLLPQTDFRLALKHIARKVGLPNVLEMLTYNFENPEEESVYYDCILKQSLEKRSLSNIWENRTLDDIRNGLEDSINRNVFSRQEVVDRCLVPLLDSPNDISGYLRQISVVQLGDVVIQRLESTDLMEFFGRVLNSYNEYELHVTLSKEVLMRVESPSDVVSVFKDCVSAQNEERGNQIMVEMFKYISEKLSVNTLLELHVDFLKRISSLSSSEK